ncbi:MAG: DNA repair protein RecO [Gemmatimonadaceae bacterium]|nr:DNA repair protein RecO [Gemmatimonadaceae bacterium]
MSLLTTDAIVLHSFDYLESSRILRLATREAGVQSVIAKGARRAKGSSRMTLDLFVEGSAQLYLKPGRDLHTLGGFDLARTRPGLAADLGRFAGAHALAELMLRFVRDDAAPEVYDALLGALDRLEASAPGDGAAATLAGAWHIVAQLGVAPALDSCAVDGVPVERGDEAAFSHAAGGVLCPRCAAERGGRRFPWSARSALLAWTDGQEVAPFADPATAKAHQRLLREYLQQHLADGRPLRALDAWERERWVAD